MRFVYTNGEKLGYYVDGVNTEYDSTYVVNYRETLLRAKKNREWKDNGKAAQMDDYYFMQKDDESVDVALTGIALVGEQDELVYSFTVNESSGIYKKILDDELKTESHIVSTGGEFRGVTARDGKLVASVLTNFIDADIVFFDKIDGDFKYVTGGDSFDENPFIENERTILFNSYGVGRDVNNNFVKYMPSELYRLDVLTLYIEEVKSDPKYSYIKPVSDGEGRIYAIKKPADDEGNGDNPILEILLIPVRIVQAIVGFISSFVMCFAGKPLVSGQSGKDVGKNREDERKVFVNNNLIEVDKELKKNKKQEDYGFIPSSWKLVELCGKEEKELCSGVADYCLTDDKKIVFTNGKHIFLWDGEKRKKLLDVDCCLHVGK